MDLQNLFKQDDAVSPVIGVILMVAITVMLAAVIASFVLGLGDTAGEIQPTSSMNFDYDETAEELTIKIADGNSITAENLYIRGDLNVSAANGTIDVSWDESGQMENALYYDSGSNPAPGTIRFEGVGGYDISADDEVRAGQGIAFNASVTTDQDDLRQYDIDIVWDTGADSATLDSHSGPDA